jgi:hypothetical protein
MIRPLSIAGSMGLIVACATFVGHAMAAVAGLPPAAWAGVGAALGISFCAGVLLGRAV